jgi:hypothetical protein
MMATLTSPGSFLQGAVTATRQHDLPPQPGSESR